MENNSMLSMEDEEIELPPGFRFHPTDEELITHYLSQKVLDNCFCARAIGEADFNKCEPWDLPWRAKMGEKEWYFFCVKDRKYPTGLRTNRATDAGYWKATGKDKEIYRAKTLVGMKKTLVFYRGRAPKGERTNWVMHEYRLEGKYSVYNLPKAAKNEWVLCRVFQKSSGGQKTHISGLVRLSSDRNESSQLPPLMESSPQNSDTRTNNIGDTSHVTCFSNPMEEDKKRQDDKVDSFNTTLLALSSSSNKSPASALFPKTSPPNSLYYPQISPTTANLYNPDSGFLANQSILIAMLNQPNSKTGLSPVTCLSTDMSSAITSHELGRQSFEDQGGPSSSVGPVLVDLDCLWTY